ncbi:leucine-rich repeat, cysteine-containing subtype protein [Tanacetum coccineum]
MRSLSIGDLPVTRYSIVLPFLNQIRKLKLLAVTLNHKCQCLFFEKCPNLEVLFTQDVCGDRGLQVIGQFCKKLRKLTHNGVVTHVGLIDVAKGCTDLESIKISLRDVTNEALECVGTHLKNLRDFRIRLGKEDGIADLPLDNGVRAMLMGCNKLERLDISLRHEGLTDVGLEYIGKYGANLRSLSLTHIGKSNAGLVKLSEGCPRLRKLKLRGCPFCEQVVARYVFNILSLRYVWFDNTDRESSDRESSDGESSDGESSDGESSDHESSDRESSDRESSDRESSDRESSDRDSSDCVRTYLALTRPEFQL